LTGRFVLWKKNNLPLLLFKYRIVSCRGKQSPPRARQQACESSSVSWLWPSLWLGKSTARGLWSKANSISPYGVRRLGGFALSSKEDAELRKSPIQVSAVEKSWTCTFFDSLGKVRLLVRVLVR